MVGKLKLLQLPNEVLDKILLNLSYDEIAKNRVVCKKFNATCGELLNRGFLNIERRHSTILKRVKSMLPRRESERRVHDLARHSDILTAIETRISMLRMTFMKYIDSDACYFIPGKVIDEIRRILLIVEGATPPPRTHEVLQELRDISSMAMEHFDEKIAPGFKLHRPNPFQTVIPSQNMLYPPTTIPKIDTTRKDVSLLQHRTLHQRLHIKMLEKTVARLLIKVKKQNTVLRGQFTKIKEQSLKIKNQDAKIADLARHVDEWDLKFADLVAELSRARDETSSTNSGPTTAAAPPPSSPVSATTSFRPMSMLVSQPRQFKTNIKPRVAQALPRSISCNEPSPLEPERKRKLGVTSSAYYAPVPAKVSRVHSTDDDTDDIRSLLRCHNENYSKITPFMSSSLETLVKSPINSIQSRKRKSQ